MANDTNHSLQELLQSSHLDAVNFAWIDSLYEDYLRDPSQVSPNWREFFLKLSSNADSRIDTSHAHYAERFLDISLNKPEQIVAASDDTISFEKKSRVNALINAYREKGHQAANIDPLQLLNRERPASLELDFHRLQASDLEQNFLVNSTFFPEQKQSLQQLVDNLNKCYCGTMGVEYMYITDIEQRQWLQQKLESTYGHPDFDGERKLRIMERLSAGEGLEKSLGGEIPRHQALRLGGRRSLDTATRRAHPKKRQLRHERDRARHGAPRAAERTGKHLWQKPQRVIRRVRGQDQHRQRQRRRQIPHGLLLERHDLWRHSALGSSF